MSRIPFQRKGSKKDHFQLQIISFLIRFLKTVQASDKTKMGLPLLFMAIIDTGHEKQTGFF